MEDILNPKPSNEIAYHYTDIDALINILQNDHIHLRATSCLYLNDTKEIIEGIESIKRVEQKNDISKWSFRDYYLTSFSKMQDSLTMWGMYASNGNGCAIGFHLDTIKHYYGMYIRCTYGKDAIDSELESFLHLSRIGSSAFFPQDGSKSRIIEHSRNDIDKMVQNQYISTCLGSKNESYQFEEEVRCVLCNTGNRHPICVKNKNGIIIPYVNIAMPKDAVKEIIIGPTNKEIISHESIIHFLEIKGYANVNVKLSEVPYRG